MLDGPLALVGGVVGRAQEEEQRQQQEEQNDLAICRGRGRGGGWVCYLLGDGGDEGSAECSQRGGQGGLGCCHSRHLGNGGGSEDTMEL